MLSAGDVEAARRACLELEDLAAKYDSAMLGAMVAHARGSLHLAEGEPRDALVELRGAGETGGRATRRLVRRAAGSGGKTDRVPGSRRSAG